MLFLRKPMADFSISKYACFWCHVPYGSTFGRPSSFSFFLSGWNPTVLVRKFFVAISFFIAPCTGSPRYCSFAWWEVTLGFLLFLAGSLIPEKDVSGRPSSLSFFLSGWNPTLLVRKFFVAISFFIALCSGSPRYCSFALWEVTLGFLLFVVGSLIPEKDVSALCFLCFFWHFPLSCLNPVLAVLYALGSRLSFFTLVFLPSSDLDLFSFFFLHRLWGLSFYGFWASSLLSLPPLFLISFSMAPCVIPLGLGAVIF